MGMELQNCRQTRCSDGAFHLIYMGRRSTGEHDAAPHTATSEVQTSAIHETHTAARDRMHLSRVRQADRQPAPEDHGPGPVSSDSWAEAGA